MIMALCNVPEIMKVMKIVNTIITIIKISVPIILIVTGMITFVKAITDDKDGLGEALKIFTKKAIAAVLIFLVPAFINIIVNAIDPDNQYMACFNYVGSVEDLYIQKIEELIEDATKNKNRSSIDKARLYLSNIKDESLKKQYEEILDQLESSLESGGYYIDPNKVDTITILTTNPTIEVGETFKIAIQITPESATNKEVVWSSLQQLMKMEL